MFDGVSNVLFASNRALAVTYAADGVDVTIAKPGDANLDRQVNFADLLALARAYNGSGVRSWINGDVTGDGVTNFNDLLVLARNYGTQAAATPTTGSAAFDAEFALAIAMVPEPTTGLFLGTLLISATRRHR